MLPMANRDRNEDMDQATELVNGTTVPFLAIGGVHSPGPYQGETPESPANHQPSQTRINLLCSQALRHKSLLCLGSHCSKCATHFQALARPGLATGESHRSNLGTRRASEYNC
jgi:hypothetical protein